MSNPSFRKTLTVLLIAGPVLLAGAILLMLLTSAPIFKYGLVGPLLLAAVVALIAAGKLWYSERRTAAGGAPAVSVAQRLEQLFSQLAERYEQDGISDIGHAVTWIILLGPLGAGKTSSLLGAGFVPLTIETVDADGTRGTTHRLPDNCTWWESRAHRTIALELELNPSGGFGKADADSDVRALRREWRKLLRWLGRRRLLDAVIVQMGVDQLDGVLRDVNEALGRGPQQRVDERARHLYLLTRLRRLWPARLREHFDEVRTLTSIDPPVYFVFSRGDSLPGFTPFCTAEPNPRIWGGGLESPGGSRTRSGIGRLMHEQLMRLASDLEDRAAARFAISGAALAGLRFPKELALRSSLWCAFVEAFYAVGVRGDFWPPLLRQSLRPAIAPYLRGFYICSAQQGGAPLRPLEQPGLFTLLRGADALPDDPPGTRALFLGYFAEMQKYAREEQRLLLSAPPFFRIAAAAVACLLGTLAVGLSYQSQRRWLHQLKTAAGNLATKQSQSDKEHRLCEKSLSEYKDLRQKAQAKFSALSSVDLAALRQESEEKLRAHIERYCIAPILPHLAERLGPVADCQRQLQCADYKPLDAKARSETDASKVRPGCAPQLEITAAADLYRHFKMVALLRQDLELCGGLQTNREDQLYLADYVLQARFEQSTDKPDLDKVKPELKSALEFYFEWFVSAQQRLTAMPKELREQALCAGQRLRRLPPSGLYEVLSHGDDKNPGGDSGLVPRMYHFAQGCRPFDERLKKDRWLASCVVAAPAATTTLPSQRQLDSYRKQYAAEYLERWTTLIKQLWTFPSETYHAKGPFTTLCNTSLGRQPGRRNSLVRGEAIAILSAEATDSAVSALAAGLSGLETRLKLLALAAPPAGAVQNREDFCTQLAQPFWALRDFEPDPSGKSQRPLLAAFNGYLKALSAVQQLVAELKPYNYQKALSEVQKTVPGGQSALGTLRLQRASLILALSSSGSGDVVQSLETSLKQVERSVWEVLLRMAAEQLQAKLWKGVAQAVQPTLSQPAQSCQSRVDKAKSVKDMLNGPANVLKSFCDGESFASCAPRASFSDSLEQDLVLNQALTSVLRNYLFVPPEECLPTPVAPVPGPPPPPPPAATPAEGPRPSLIPRRVFFPHCKRDDFKLRFKNIGAAAASIECKPEPRANADDTWLWLACSANPAYDGTLRSKLYGEYQPSNTSNSRNEATLRGDSSLLDPVHLCQGRRNHSHDGIRILLPLDQPFEPCPTKPGLPSIEVTFQSKCAEPTTPLPAPVAAAPAPLPSLPECIVEWKLPPGDPLPADKSHP